ncbi:MinD/ParA family protein [Candidatus Bathyarchaeota archaeon]|nr:MAG: MinD/ParA family protein [Candidatus Bathyarchaeota archaeon]
MGKVIAVHSYKGGTGKTILSINLAAALVKHGKKVCLMDLDFRAPSLSTLLKVEKADYWLNDYLNGICGIDKVLIDLTERIRDGGKLFVGLANPTTEAIRDISAKDRKWEMRALGRLLSLRNTLLNDKGFDYLVFDTSPGLQYSSINAIVSADLVIVASTLDKSDVEGTKRMLKELYDLFEKKTRIVTNKVLYGENIKSVKDVRSQMEELYGVPILGVIPCFCDVSRAKGTLIFVEDKPDHPFTKIMDEIATELEKMKV